MEEAKKRLHKEINEHCLLRGVNLPAKGGGTYSWIFYMRKRLFTPAFLTDVGEVFLHLMRERFPDMGFQIAGVETGSTPLVVGLPLVAHQMGIKINSFSIRKHQKEYGLQNWMEGVPNEKPVVVVDDIYNSGGTMMRCLDVMGMHQIVFSGVVFSIIKRTPVSKAMGENTDYVSIFNLSDFGLS
jgi:orotate phosphoribosyltransferase